MEHDLILPSPNVTQVGPLFVGRGIVDEVVVDVVEAEPRPALPGLTEHPDAANSAVTAAAVRAGRRSFDKR